MTAFKDITGMRFGRLLAERFVEFRSFGTVHAGARAAWEFRCDCGGRVVMLAQTVKAKDFIGRGCVDCVKAARPRLTHGESDTRLHRIWIGVRTRCRNPNDTAYQHYGGRGITVAAEWDDFVAFRDWSTANGYAENLELDRRDNSGPYAPNNCRWVAHKANCQNTRRSRHVEYCGRRMTVSQMAAETGVHLNTLRLRLSKGMTAAEALAVPARTRRVEWRGRQLTLAELSAETGIPKNTIYNRVVRDKMTVDQALSLPRDTWATRRLRQQSR